MSFLITLSPQLLGFWLSIFAVVMTQYSQGWLAGRDYCCSRQKVDEQAAAGTLRWRLSAENSSWRLSPAEAVSRVTAARLEADRQTDVGTEASSREITAGTETGKEADGVAGGGCVVLAGGIPAEVVSGQTLRWERKEAGRYS